MRLPADEAGDGEGPARLLDWDSDHFGFGIGRVVDGPLTTERSGEVGAWAASRGVRCVYYLCDAADEASRAVAEATGFEAVDVRVDLSWAVTPSSRRADPRVRPFVDADRPHVTALARTAFSTTRFAADRSFPPDRVAALYERWVARSLESPGSAVLVLDDGSGPAGFVTCDDASIGLVAVDPEARGRGHGETLVRAAQAHFAGQGVADVTTATQARNAAALRTFERCGFRQVAEAVWYHRWFPAA